MPDERRRAGRRRRSYDLIMKYDALELLVRNIGEKVHSPSAGSRAWVLVDPIVRDPFEDVQLEGLGVQKIRIPVPGRSRNVSGFPYLLPLETTSHGVELLRLTCIEALQEQSDPEIEAARGFAIGAWLTSSCNEVDLVQHWAKVCSVRVKGAGRRYLRLVDRRVLHWLWRGMSDAQRSYAAGPSDNLLLLDRCSEVIELPKRVEGNIHSEPDIWRFSAQSLDLCEVIQAMLRGWSRFQSPLPADYMDRAELVIREAIEAGGRGIHDQVLLGAYALQVSPYICRSPKIRSIVGRCNDEGDSLSMRLSELRDSDWIDIATAINLNHPEKQGLENIQGANKNGVR